MATAWLKGIHCKSSVLDDIVYHPLPFDATAPRNNPPKPPSPSTSQSSSSSASTSSPNKKSGPLLPLGCGNSNRDVVPLFARKHGARVCRGSPNTAHHHNGCQQQRHSKVAKQQQGGKKAKGRVVDKGTSQQHHRLPLNSLKSPSPVFCAPSSFPTLTELPRGHSSRQVVEIIFTSSWTDQTSQQPLHQMQQHFPGEIEMLFRVHNPSAAVSRFEACRAAVRSRAGASDARCAADGNEMMRFRPASAVPMAKSAATALQPPGKGAAASSVVFSASVCSGSGSVVRTYSGSGEAHDSGDGGGRSGRRAMLVCRVIAGRVRPDDDSCNGSASTGVPGEDYEYDSVAVGKGELLVFDPGAVLPCFLIIYKLLS